MSKRQDAARRPRTERTTEVHEGAVSGFGFRVKDTRVFESLARRSQFLTPTSIIKCSASAGCKLAFLMTTDFFTEAQLYAFSCDFAEHVLPIFERVCPDEKSMRRCIDRARAFLAGKGSFKQLSAAVDAVQHTLHILEPLDTVLKHAAWTAGMCATCLLDTDDKLVESLHDVAGGARSAARMTELAAANPDADPHDEAYSFDIHDSELHIVAEAEWQLARVVEDLDKMR